jgi:UDP-glucose 6-dehydrogenase
MRNPKIQLLGIHPDLVQQDPIIASARARGKKSLFVMSWVEAECAKLAINSYLSVKACWALEVADLVDRVGADPKAVLEAVGADERIGSMFFKPGTVPGGDCLPRDVVALIDLAEKVGPGPHFAPMIIGPYLTRQNELERVMQQLDGAKLVAILGMAFKSGVPRDTESLGRRVADALEKRGQAYYVVDYDMQETPPPSNDAADAVVLCLPDQRLADLVRKYHSECPVIIDPWRAL